MSFTVDDLVELTDAAVVAWHAGVERDWSERAGTLTWSCFQTADHTIDCVFAYAFFLSSRVTDAYPPFGEVHALPEATPNDLVNGLVAMTNLLIAIIRTTPSDVRAIIWRHPEPAVGAPADFAARGALEMVLHTHDICAGLGVPFTPPEPACLRLRDHTASWPFWPESAPTADPWS